MIHVPQYPFVIFLTIHHPTMFASSENLLITHTHIYYPSTDAWLEISSQEKYQTTTTLSTLSPSQLGTHLEDVTYPNLLEQPTMQVFLKSFDEVHVLSLSNLQETNNFLPVNNILAVMRQMLAT